MEEDTTAQPEVTAPVPGEPDAPEEFVGKPIPLAKRVQQLEAKYRASTQGPPITFGDVDILDASATDPVEAPSRIVTRAIKTLGLRKEGWSLAKLRAAQEFGRFLNMRITGRILLVRSFNCIEQVEKAMEVVGKIAEDEKVPAEDRVSAVGMMAKAAEAYAKLSDQMMTLAEKTAPKISTEKPRNLPPTLAVQVNVAGPQTTPGSPATSGGEVQVTASPEGS